MFTVKKRLIPSPGEKRPEATKAARPFPRATTYCDPAPMAVGSVECSRGGAGGATINYLNMMIMTLTNTQDVMRRRKL